MGTPEPKARQPADRLCVVFIIIELSLLFRAIRCPTPPEPRNRPPRYHATSPGCKPPLSRAGTPGRHSLQKQNPEKVTVPHAGFLGKGAVESPKGIGRLASQGWRAKERAIRRRKLARLRRTLRVALQCSRKSHRLRKANPATAWGTAGPVLPDWVKGLRAPTTSGWTGPASRRRPRCSRRAGCGS